MGHVVNMVAVGTVTLIITGTVLRSDDGEGWVIESERA